MPAEQASDTGCNLEDLTQGWASKSVLEDSLKTSLFFIKQKRKLCDSIVYPEFFRDYLEQPCIPEILAFNFCLLNKREDLLERATLLQAFQTYTVSLYDQIDDNHLFRGGEKTILGLYGLKKTSDLKKFCEDTYFELTKKLEVDLPNASIFAREQYLLTLTADKLRNQKTILSPSGAIALQNLLAGIPTEKIALLSGGGSDLVDLARSLGNALSTIDDLIDLINLEDLNKKKTTIPLAYLRHFKIKGNSKISVRDSFLKSKAFFKSLEYLNGEINNAQDKLNSIGATKENLLNRYLFEMKRYLGRLENVR